jgi:tetratricopeptide (TPR) repeat protein
MINRELWQKRRHLAGAILLASAFFLGMGFIPLQATANESGEIFLARGIKFYLDGKYKEATEQFEQGVKADPENPEIWLMLGTSYLNLKEYLPAKEDLTKALSLDPLVPRGKLFLGVAYFYLENFPEAKRLIEEARADFPSDPLVLHYSKLIADYEKRPEEIRGMLIPDYDLTPQYASIYRRFGDYFERTKKAIPELDVSFTTGIEYDDNVKVLPNTSLINPPGQKQQKGHKGDWRMPLDLRIEYRPYTSQNSVLGLRSYTYGGVNTYLDDFNIFDSLSEIFYRYRYKDLAIEPFYSFDKTLLGGQPYSTMHNVGLRFNLRETPYLFGDLIYIFQSREFQWPALDGGFAADGYLNSVGFFQTLVKGGGTLRAGTIWERQVTKGINFTWNKYRFPLEGFYFNLPYHLIAYGYFEYARTAFSNADSVFHRHNYADYYNVIAQLRRPITSYMDLIASYSHTSQVSNAVDWQYERNIYSLLVSFYY